MRSLLLLALLALGAACVDTTPRCAPDAEVRGCFCPSGRVGAQRCTDDGLSLGACVCAPEDGGADVPDAATSDAPADVDASAPADDAAQDASLEASVD